MTRREYFEMLRRNRLGNEYENIMPNRSLPVPEEREFVPEAYERFMPYHGMRRRPMIAHPVDRIPYDNLEEAIPDYWRGNAIQRKRSYPDQRTMEYRPWRDYDPNVSLDDGVFRPSDPRYRNVRLEPMADIDYEDVGF